MLCFLIRFRSTWSSNIRRWDGGPTTGTGSCGTCSCRWGRRACLRGSSSGGRSSRISRLNISKFYFLAPGVDTEHPEEYEEGTVLYLHSLLSRESRAVHVQATLVELVLGGRARVESVKSASRGFSSSSLEEPSAARLRLVATIIVSRSLRDWTIQRQHCVRLAVRKCHQNLF